MASIHSMAPTTSLSASASSSSPNVPTEAARHRASSADALFETAPDSVGDNLFRAIAEELSHWQVVAQFHAREGNLLEVQHCLKEIEQIAGREEVLRADEATRTLVTTAVDRLGEMLDRTKFGPQKIQQETTKSIARKRMFQEAAKIREDQEHKAVQYLSTETLESPPSTINKDSGQMAKTKKTAARAKLAEEARAIDAALERRRFQFIWKPEREAADSGEPRTNANTWHGRPPTNEEWFKCSLNQYLQNQKNAAQRWAILEAEKNSRVAQDGQRAAAAYLQAQRDRLFSQPAVQHARRYRCLKDAQKHASGYVRKRPNTYAKPWNQEQRHILRKWALKRSIVSNKRPREDDAAEAAPSPKRKHLVAHDPDDLEPGEGYWERTRLANRAGNVVPTSPVSQKRPESATPPEKRPGLFLQQREEARRRRAAFFIDLAFVGLCAVVAGVAYLAVKEDLALADRA